MVLNPTGGDFKSQRGGEVRLEVYEDMCHVFQVLRFMDVSQVALTRAMDFINQSRRRGESFFTRQSELSLRVDLNAKGEVVREQSLLPLMKSKL